MSAKPEHVRLTFLALLLAVSAAGVLVLDARCQIVDAMVVSKQEHVEALIDPHWRPVRDIVVRYTPLGDDAIHIPWKPEYGREAVVTPLPVSLDEYDRLRPGEPVRVRYFPLLPDLARLADQSLAGVVFGPLWDGLREAGIMLDIAYLGWLVVSARMGWWPRLITRDPRALGLWAVHLILLQALPLSLLGVRDLLPPPSEPSRTSQAIVQELQLVSSVGQTRWVRTYSALAMDLPQPFVRVSLRLIPDGTDQPVMAVDDVSAAHSGALQVGDDVAVRYAPSAPRLASLVSADRQHRWENRRFVHGVITAPFAILAVFGQVAAWLLWCIGRMTRPTRSSPR